MKRGEIYDDAGKISIKRLGKKVYIPSAVDPQLLVNFMETSMRGGSFICSIKRPKIAVLGTKAPRVINYSIYL